MRRSWLSPVIAATGAWSWTGTAGGGSSATWSCANTLASRHPGAGCSGIRAGVAPLLEFAFAGWAGCPDADGAAAFDRAVAEGQPGPEPRDAFCGGVLLQDQSTLRGE